MSRQFSRGWSRVLISLLIAVDVTAQPFGLTERTVVQGVNFPLDDPGPGSSGDAELVRAFPNLSFSAPVLLTSAGDGTNRIFVVEKNGRIKVFANSDSVSSTTTFLDITSKVDPDNEQGLLGLAFDPQYASNGIFYVYYSVWGGARRSRISRFHVNLVNPSLADPASEEIVLEVAQPASYSNHKGGMIAFGHDNMLYIGLGDGGSGGDPDDNAQDCGDMLGKMLRIDVRGSKPYTIPSNNPYAGSSSYSCGRQSNRPSRICGIAGYGNNEICKEVWVSGHRNPWRFSVDRVSGNIWVADVGQDTYEEVDIDSAGKNMGWRCYEGNHDYNGAGCGPKASYTFPIYEYSHSSPNGGSSVTGGYVYRGSGIPSLYGQYIYGDYGSGRVWAMVYDGTRVTSNTQIASLASISSFGEDEPGEVYVISFNGTVNRLRKKVGGPSGGSIPTKLSDTGLFSDVLSLTPTPGSIAYDVNAPLWSDYAEKRRWIALPGTSTINFHPNDNYVFPVGTAVVKHFDLRLSSSTVRRLETRVMFRHNQGWKGYTYKWNDTQTDALLLADGDTVSDTFSVDASAPGGARQQTWTYPTRNDCLSCHTAPAGYVLSVRTRQLNRNFNYPNATDNQLRSWNHIGLFSTDIGSQTQYEAYANYSDTTQLRWKRARAYLAANCAQCHLPGIPRSEEIDLRYDTLLQLMKIRDVRPTYGDLGLTDSYRVKSGVKESSVLWERMRRTDGNRMPPLGSSIVDPVGRDLIGQWIDIELADRVGPAAPTGLNVQ